MLKEDGVGAVLAYLKGMVSLMNTLVRRILKKDETLGLPDEQEKGVFEIMPTGLPPVPSCFPPYLLCNMC